MVKKWLFLFVVAVLFVPSLGHTEENNAITLSSVSVGDASTEKQKLNTTDDEKIEENVVILNNDSADDGPAEERKVYTAEGFFDVVTADGEPVEIKLRVEYYRHNPTGKFVLSVDEAGDRAFGSTLIAYRAAAREISSATLRSKEGLVQLVVGAFVVIGHLNAIPFEPRVTGIDIYAMTFNPDPESLGRPTIFSIGEESGDAEAGI